MINKEALLSSKELLDIALVLACLGITGIGKSKKKIADEIKEKYGIDISENIVRKMQCGRFLDLVKVDELQDCEGVYFMTSKGFDLLRLVHRDGFKFL